MDIIQSKDNALIKEIKKLKQRKYRDSENKFFIEGLRFVEEAFKAEMEIQSLLIVESKESVFDSFLNSWPQFKEIRKYIVRDNLYKDVFDTESPQGIGAIVNKKNSQDLRKSGLYILLDRLQDPGNVGTIIRTAHAAGAAGILYTNGTVDPYNEKALRASMGSIFYIPIIEDKNLNLVENLRKDGYKLVVSSLEASKNFFEIEYDKNIVIAVGNEGNGISEEVENISDIKVKLPMPGGAESLNASVAASIMIYENLRQNLK